MPSSWKIPVILSGRAATVTLPQNLLLASGTLYEDFETVGDWTATSGSRAADTTNFKTGTQSIKLTSSVGGGGRFNKTVNSDFSNFGRLSFWVYVYSPLADYSGSIQIHLSETTNFATYWRAFTTVATFLDLGWNLLSYPKDKFSAGAGSPNWSNPIVRVRFDMTAQAGKTNDTSFDTLTTGISAVPAVLLRFDDGYASAYTAFQYMRPRGIRGTVYVETQLIDTANHLTLAQIQEMDAAGWTIGNHTNASTSLAGQSEADQETQIAAGQTALAGWGLSRGVNYLDFPGGNWDANTVTAMTNLGVVLGHTTEVHTSRELCLPMSNLFRVQSTGTNGVSLATAKSYVDSTITRQSILPLHFHDIGTGVGELSTADFQALIDYIVTKKQAGLMYPITVDDFYKLTTGSVAIPA